MKRVRFLKKPGYYNGTYPVGGVCEVDDNFAAYALGMEDVELVGNDVPVTDPIPYNMKPKEGSVAEQALVTIANALSQRPVPAEPAAGPLKAMK